MPNHLIIDGHRYGLPSPNAATSMLFRVKDSIERSIEEGKPVAVIWDGNVNGDEQAHFVVMVSSATTVHAVFDRDPASELSKAWDQQRQEFEELYAERSARQRAEYEAEQSGEATSPTV